MKREFLIIFLSRQIPYDMALRHMIVEICCLYDGERNYPWLEPDRSITRDETVERLVKIHRDFEGGYDGLFNDYWRSDPNPHKYGMKNTQAWIDLGRVPYKEYLDKYAP